MGMEEQWHGNGVVSSSRPWGQGVDFLGGWVVVGVLVTRNNITMNAGNRGAEWIMGQVAC